MKKWTDGPTMPKQLVSDWRSLVSLLDTFDHRDIPCRANGYPYFWTSDDLEDQDTAAICCRPCPAIEQCQAFGLKHPHERGVYGGLTQANRTAPSRTSPK